MKLISDELRYLESEMRQSGTGEDMIRVILKAHIDGISPKDIVEVMELSKKWKEREGITHD